MKIAVIGGGASGMMVAGICAQNGHKVDLFEANDKLGKKLYITGKGRCNVTNACEPTEFLNNVVTNPKFLYSSIYAFDSYSCIEFFKNLGVPIKIERGNRAFPESDKSSDIIKALVLFLNKNNVNILLNHKVISLYKIDNKFLINTIFGMYNNYDITICCTGGVSYSATGSTGDGYKFAKQFGHNIIPAKASLVPILLFDSFIKELQGLSLKNVKLTSFINSKKYKEFFGELLFTSNGISGPIALSMSSYITGKNNVSLKLDLKPALSFEQLKNRLLRDIESNREVQLSTLMQGLLPKSLVNPFINSVGLTKEIKVKSLTVKDIDDIVYNLKEFNLTFHKLDCIDYGIITSGGVDVKEINPQTMESKICKNLYFVGEVLDVDALTGGFNLQIAFSTAFLCANSIS